MTRLHLAWSVCLAAIACGGKSDLPDADDGQCQARAQERTLEGAGHVPDCSAVSYVSNPPSSGSHYEHWAAHGVYDSALPRGFWVHNLEHGAVVLSYHCPEQCPDEVERAEQLVNELPEDESCPSGRRVLLLPDPLLDVRWAASAWGFTLRAECFDANAFRRFYVEHHGRAPEDVCSDGVDFRNPDGSLTLPPSCAD